ncbi:hypothetical protein OROHE_025345 [Orobanche hederae]
MESNAMPGGIYSNVQTSSMLGLEVSLHHHPPLPPQNPHHHMPNYGRRDEIHHPQTQQPAKQAQPVPTKPQAQTLILSDDEDPGFASGDDGRRKIMSPWHRMKWTDNMVRLLIMVVFYIGDEVVSEANNNNSHNNNSDKKKVGGGGGGGISQKKGKWKSVSRAMMERGFYVSPQQCEDKFNDLNKRYKRVNDILGKGVSCRVVENQSLLETMDHISPKLKEEVRKLLNSKHLFFREMCTYHSNGGGGCVSGGVHAEPPQVAVAAQPGKCLHSMAAAATGNKNNDNNNNDVVPNLNREENEGTIMSKLTSDDDDDDDDVGDNDDDDVHDADDGDGIDDDMDFSDSSSGKRRKKGTSFDPPPLFQELDFELANILQDGSKSASEKRQWMKAKVIRLEEERVGIQLQSFQIKKQHLKWLKFSGKKEREMERERLTNQRLRLENERMVLIVRQKELDLIDHQRHHHHQHQHS